MQPKKRLLLSLLIVAALAQGPAVLRAGDRYYDADMGFSLQFPDGWAVEEHFMGTDVAAYSPDPATRLTVNVVTEELPGEVTLDEYFEVSVTAVGSVFEGFVVHEHGQTTLSGTPARWLVYSYGSGQVAFKALAYLMVANNTGFTLTCGSRPETFTQGRPTLERIAGTFRIEARERNGAQIPAQITLPEIAVTIPEPAPTETTPQPYTALPTAPDGKSFTIAIEQDGQPIQVVDHTARLRKKPFVLVFKFRARDSVLVNASMNPQSYEAARVGAPLKDIAGFGAAGLIEGMNNMEQEVILSDTDYQYWFYDSPSINRFDKTSEDGGSIVCRRTIAKVFLSDKQRSLPIERFTGEALYLVLIKATRPNLYVESREYQREYLKLLFGD